MKYCIYCGAKIITGSNYCGECGKKLTFASEKKIDKVSLDELIYVEEGKSENVSIDNSSDDIDTVYNKTNNSSEDIINNQYYSNANIILKENDSEDIVGKNKESGFRKFIRLFIVAISFIALSLYVNILIGYLFFPLLPIYKGNYIITSAILMSSFLAIVRYLTLMRFNNKQRIIIVLKNILIISLIISFQGYLLIQGKVLISIFFIMVLIFDKLSENSYADKILDKTKRLKPLELFTLIILIIAIVLSSISGKYNFELNNVLELIREEESMNKTEDYNSSSISNSDQITKPTNIDHWKIDFKQMDMDVNNIMRRRMIKHYGLDAVKAQEGFFLDFFGDADKRRITIAKIQSELRDYGCYNGNIDGIKGLETDEAIIEYKRLNYLDDEEFASDDLNENITIGLIMDLGIESP